MNPVLTTARWLIVFTVSTVGASTGPLLAQTAAGQPAAASKLKLDTGKQIYESGCIACHGPGGRGQSQNLIGFELPATFPDFSDCPTSTPEADSQWRAIIPSEVEAQLDDLMPSFKDLLTQDQIGKVIDHLRSFCADDAWPRGNLNLPRAMITEKAFPENETVVTGSINPHGTVETSVIYEKRISATAMMEAAVPFAFNHDSGTWSSAFGDLALGYKQTLFHSLPRGSIFSVGGELMVPTGDPVVGTGVSTVFEGSSRSGNCCHTTAFCRCTRASNCPPTQTNCLRPTICEPR
jgi:mono/diheme cytochrome c family protein